jgi:hypothetical protein
MRDFLGRLRRGARPEEVQAAMMGSDEYFKLHGSRPRAFIAAMYVDVLGRAPSRSEVNVWMTTLERFGGSRERTALEFLNVARQELARRQP